MRVSKAIAAGSVLVTTLAIMTNQNSMENASSAQAASHADQRPPNIVVIFADDMGYADTGSYGHPTINTPTLDRLAHEGQKWTNFYSASSVCSPSRAALMTGRLPIRTGLGPDHSERRVLFPTSEGGLPQREITIAEVLKEKGYATAAVGKWHLGHLPEFLPMNQGFDSYYGIPYSNDMDAPGGPSVPWTVDLFFEKADINNWDVPLMQNDQVVERPANQWTIASRYTEKALDFIDQNKDRPFFLYLAPSFPHVPLFASKDRLGKSARGLYGDVIEEIDWSVGEVIRKLEELGIDDNTLVVFTSDNGPWLIMSEHGGSAGLLRDGKGTTWEGGMREPAMFWWPGTIKSGTKMGIGSTLDLLPTIASIAGVELPGDRIYDGVDLTETLTGDAASPRDEMFYYRLQDVYAYRKGAYKVHFITESSYGGEGRVELTTPLLFNVDIDPSESFDIAAEHPDLVVEMRELVEQHRSTIKSVPNELNRYPLGDLGGEESDSNLRPYEGVKEEGQ